MDATVERAFQKLESNLEDLTKIYRSLLYIVRKEKEKVKTGCGNYSCKRCSIGPLLKFLPQSTNCFEDNNARKAIFAILISYKQDNELKNHLEKGRF